MSQKRIIEKDLNQVWHSMFRYGSKKEPMVVKEAEGVYVTDIYDNKYLEGMSGLWCVNVGYGREELAQVAYDQLLEMNYCALTNSHVPAVELADKLNSWLDDDYIFYYSNSGSEANETAFKIARQYFYQAGHPGKFKFISRYRAYHGNSFGALAATGQSHRKHRYEPLAPGFLHVHPPDCYRCAFNKKPESCELECAEAIEWTIKWEDSNTIAGMILEPIITGGGVILPRRDDYLKRVEEICKKYQVLFIVDEVICGFGRTGDKFGFMGYGVTPDIITMAKGISSGYLPLAATAVKKDLFEKFTDVGEYEHLRHINTYGGHPAACAVGLKNIEIIERENLAENAKTRGEQLEQELQDLYNSPHVGDIRCKGLLTGIELVEDKQTQEPLADSKVGQVIGECKKRGLIVGKNSDTIAGYNNIITIAPPLIVSEEDVSFIANTFKEAVNTLN